MNGLFYSVQVLLNEGMTWKAHMGINDLFQKAKNLFANGKHEESIKCFTRYIEDGGETHIAFLSRGVAFLKLKQQDNAISDFSRAVELNNNNFRAFFYRGMANMTKENYNEAIRDFKRSIRLRPDDGKIYFALGIAYAQTGNREKAAKNIRTAVICSESVDQGFDDYIGILRSHFNKAIDLTKGESDGHAICISDKEMELIHKWLYGTTH